MPSLTSRASAQIAADDSVHATTAIRQAAWCLVPLLAIGYLISYIDRANIGFAALTMGYGRNSAC